MPHFRKKNSDKEMNSFMTASQTKAVTVGEISNSTVAKDIFNKYVEECEKRVGRDEAVTDKVDFECRTAVINSLTSKESAKRKYTERFLP